MLSRRLISCVTPARNIHRCFVAKIATYPSVGSRHISDNVIERVTCKDAKSSNQRIIQVSRRFKYTKGRSDAEENEESDDEDESLDAKNVISTKVNSLRMDLLLKAGLNLARNKVEAAFYESKVRVNGQKVFKKSSRLSIGDEIDLIKGPSPTNPNFLVVSRIKILSAKEDGDAIRVKLERIKSLLIENYNDASTAEEK